MAMTSNHVSPRLLKGGLAVYSADRHGTTPRIIVFQFNPEQVRRTLALRASEGRGGQGSPGGAREDARRAAGPPVETINLTVQLHAADQLERPESNRAVVDHGLHPALATLEMLLYPPTAKIDEIERLAGRGQVQVNPASIPLTILIWGQSRVVPVVITSFGVTEEMFDEQLNPIQAKVELGLRVLTYLELGPDTIGRDAYIAYQRAKENLAGQQSSEDQRVSGMAPR